MICFPHAKINLGLYILSKRPDGYHNLETIFYPISLCDVLEIVPSAQTRLLTYGLPVPGIPADNLIMQAYQLLKKNYPGVRTLDIHLFKAIPTGAGLGGGSADAAGIIRLMVRFFQLNISDKDLGVYALALGSDCPFFLQSDPCFASGRGEILEPINLDLSGYSLLLVHPGIPIDTAWAFSKILPAAAEYDLRKSITAPVQGWKKTIRNDFEKPVFEAHPFLEKIKRKLYTAGAFYAALSGSGSTIYGIFPKGDLPASLKVENATFTFIP
jgi:4-diphosphocytidyl-2-C-methyl-D-erythritol kinase